MPMTKSFLAVKSFQSFSSFEAFKSKSDIIQLAYFPDGGPQLKEYYEMIEIVGELRPLSDFFRTHADFFLQKYISNHETQ